MSNITAETIRRCVVDVSFHEGIKRFGLELHSNLRNHNFLGVRSKYLPSGADLFCTDTENIVVRVVFANLVEKLAVKIAEHESELDEEIVQMFQSRRQAECVLVHSGCKKTACAHRKVVEIVSAFGKTVREQRFRIVGKQVKLYARQGICL